MMKLMYRVEHKSAFRNSGRRGQRGKVNNAKRGGKDSSLVQMGRKGGMECTHCNSLFVFCSAPWEGKVGWNVLVTRDVIDPIERNTMHLFLPFCSYVI